MNELLLKNAADKLRREMKSENPAEPSTMIQAKIAEALDEFCRQNNDLARDILNSQKNFADCCNNILRDTKNDRYISDFKAYQRAVEYYMPDAKIEFDMRITVNGKNSGTVISLMDLI